MYYIGFDIGGTKCAVSLGRVDGDNIQILQRVEHPTKYTAKQTFDQFVTAVEQMKADYEIAGAGISCGGPLDNQTGILTTSNLPGWHNLNIIAYIKERFSLDAKLENDANACALAEWKFGAGKGTKNMVFFTFGTGLGAGLILNGRLYAGTNGNAGEAGHIRLAKNGPFGFRKYGSFEGFCSGAGIAKLAVIMAKRRKTMPDCIREMGGYDKVTTKALAAAAFNGDAFAKKVFAKSGEKLGEGLSIIVDVLNPEKIVLGGVFMRSSALLVPSMQKALDREALEESASVCQIVEAGLKENIGDYAAISVALR